MSSPTNLGHESNWPANPDEAKRDQRRLAKKVRHQDLDLTGVRLALSIGVSYDERSSKAFAVGIPSTRYGGSLHGGPYVSAAEVSFPYIPGMFAYREGPAVEKLVCSLEFLPDLLIFDSQGMAHPRGFGLASHLGVILDLPSIGLTRNRLFGRFQEPGASDGACSPLVGHNDEIIGFAFRPLAHCDTIFVSPGHLTSIATTKRWIGDLSRVQSCFPAALAQAHALANRLARSKSKRDRRNQSQSNRRTPGE